MEQQIADILFLLGMHRTNLGFHYLRKSLLLCFENEDYMLCYIRLFSEVAAYYGTTADNVDHCIRSAIIKCWNHGNTKFLKKIAGYSLEKRPTNGEFIEMLYRYLEKTVKPVAQQHPPQA